MEPLASWLLLHLSFSVSFSVPLSHAHHLSCCRSHCVYKNSLALAACLFFLLLSDPHAQSAPFRFFPPRANQKDSVQWGKEFKRHDPLPYWPLINIWEVGKLWTDAKAESELATGQLIKESRINSVALQSISEKFQGQLCRLLQSGLDFPVPRWWMSSKKSNRGGKKSLNDPMTLFKNRVRKNHNTFFLWLYKQSMTCDETWARVRYLGRASTWTRLYGVQTDFTIKRDCSTLQ